MKIRTQLILAFLLLAVVPLAGIVLYSYITSQRAVQRTLAEEASALTAEMDGRMQAVEDDLRRRVKRLGRLPLRRLLAAESEAERQELTGRLLSEMGEVAPLVESFEFVPLPVAPQPPDAHRPPLPPDVAMPVMPEAAVRVVEDIGSIVLVISEELREKHLELEALEAEGDDAATAEAGVRFGLEFAERIAEAVGQRLDEPAPPGDDGARIVMDDVEVEDPTTAATGLEQRLRQAETQLEQEMERQQRRAERLEIEARKREVRQILQSARAEERARRPARRRPPSEERQKTRLLFGRELDVAVREEGEMVGEVKTRISAVELLHEVLESSRRGQGEIPFALDAEGELYTVEAADREILAELPLEAGAAEGGDAGGTESGGIIAEARGQKWVISNSTDPETGLLFGIARPIGEPLAEVRRTAARNLAYGLGLIALALVGILPLSERMTRNLRVVTQGAERIAAGDLTTRLPVRSRDEFGQLARTFNAMAGDLSRHQEQLLEQERMQAEYERKTRELEEARQFQLSLLPKELPRHPAFEIAVHMQTATEVGGDYYDFHLSGDGTLTAAVGDATGHGARAGTMVTVVKSLFAAYSAAENADTDHAGELSRFLTEANRTVRRMDLGRMSMGLVLAELGGGTLTLSAAGMPPALLYRHASGTVEEIALAGMPLGGLASEYHIERRDLEPGDVLLLLSDGLPELPDADDEPLGYARVRELFAAAAAKPPAELVAELAAAVDERTGGEPPNDDVTLVAVRVR